MPELPEVETIRRGLEERVMGRMFEQVEVLLPYLIKSPSVGEFIQQLQGKKIERVGRRGKYLLFFLSGEYVLVVHLRMTGQINYVKSDEALHQKTYIILTLDNGYQLRYIDPRKFGMFFLLRLNQLNEIPGLRNMGPEPLEEEFTFGYFESLLSGKKRKIKALLLDQSAIAGLGNIYVDECLFLAAIHPERMAGELTSIERRMLFNAIKQVLREGIMHRGTSSQDYFDVEGEKGTHQEHLKVYQRKGNPCYACGTPIIRQVVAGRGTHICPQCQPEKKDAT